MSAAAPEAVARLALDAMTRNVQTSVAIDIQTVLADWRRLIDVVGKLELRVTAAEAAVRQYRQPGGPA